MIENPQGLRISLHYPATIPGSGVLSNVQRERGREYEKEREGDRERERERERERVRQT